RIDGWEFVAAYVEQKNAGPEELTEDIGVEPSEVFIQNIVAGRPVLCHPSRPGGLRLRYGRTRATGLAAVPLHAATMHILDLGIPLHPRHNPFFHDLTVEELGRLRERIAVEGRLEEGRLSVPAEEAFREPLVRLGALYAVRAGRLVLERHTDVLFATLGISERDGTFHVAPNPEEADPLAFVSRLAGFPVRARAPSRIGARMARPEKA